MRSNNAVNRTPNYLLRCRLLSTLCIMSIVSQMIKKYDSTVYFVEDIHSASKWYSDIVGVEVKYENEMYAYIEKDDLKIGFHPEDRKSSHGVTGQTTYWRVGSLRTSIEFLSSKGATLYRGPICTSLNEYACILIDPFGNALGLISCSS